MTTYILRRLLLMIPTMIGITLLTFLLVRLAPGNVAEAKAGASENGAHAMTAEEREQQLKFYDLDKPWYEAYILWLRHLAVLNLGESPIDHRAVTAKIAERLPVTLTLTGASLILSYVIAIPLGIIAALKRGKLIDRTISFTVFVLYSIPSFAAALLLILWVAGGDYLNLLPMYGASAINASEMGRWQWLWDRTVHMILPVICLTYASLASISRYSRVSMLETLGQDFLRTARAKGLSERVVVLRHALRNALIPIITVFALELPVLIGGAVIIETIFTLNGMGQLIIQSIESRDTFTIMGTTVLAAVVALFAYLLADILYMVVDPRISYK